MRLPGKRVNLTQWITAGPYAVRVEVEGVVPDDDPSEPCLEPQTVRRLDELRRLADAGQVEELAKHGTVYVRRSA